MEPAKWTSSDAERLRLARCHRGHSQAECAAELKRLGAAAVKQGSVSNWETRRTAPTAGSLGPIDVYCALMGGEGPADIPGEPSARASALTLDGDSRLAATHKMAAQPLSDQQQRLIDGMIDRLRSGPPLSEQDGSAFAQLLRVLGLEQ